MSSKMKKEALTIIAVVALALIFLVSGCTQVQEQEQTQGQLVQQTGEEQASQEQSIVAPTQQEPQQPTTEPDKSRRDQILQDGNPQTQDLIESCPKNISGIFTYPIVENEEIENIPPLGHINAKNKHVIPISHTYYTFKKDGDVVRRAQIFAPADSLVESISKVDVLNKSGKLIDSDFSIYFFPCKEIRVSFIHVRELSGHFKKMYEATQPHCYVEEKTSLSLCNAGINKMIKAGDSIGWGGGSLPALDVAVDDARVINPFISPERYTPHNLQGICPLDLYSGDLKISMYNKLMDPDGNKRTTEPQCGSVAQDILGTAQGEWFIGSAREPDAESEGKVLSIIHYNLEPLPGIIAASGTIVPYSGMLAFIPRHSGFINREPSEIKDSNIYCFQNEQGEFTKYVIGDGRLFTGRILIQLIDAKTLKAEYQEKSCDESLNFSSPIIYER